MTATLTPVPAEQPEAPPTGPARRPRRTRSDLRVAMLFLLPATVGFGTFFLWPTLRGFYLSFTDYTLLAPPVFTGLDNYRELAADPLFWNAMKVTLVYVVLNIGFQTVLALGLAVLMHRLTKSTLVRGLILMPWLIANVVAALVWFWMLDYQIGIVNVMLDWVGIDPVAFFGDTTTAIPTIAFVNVWRHVGYTALLIFAGLQTIPHSLYEAAALDGASEWRTFWRVTFPLLRPVLALVLVITVAGSFQVFDTVAVTTAGGPENATRVIYYYIYQRAFERFDFGYASAMSVVLFLVLVGVAFAQLRFFRSNESDLS
jgi:multiple sugar transport system permease protein